MENVSVEQIREAAQEIKKMGETGTPPESLPKRLEIKALKEQIARTMALSPTLPDSYYVYRLVDKGFKLATGRRIVKKARAMSATIEVPVLIQQPATKPSPVPASGGVVVAGKEKGTEATVSAASPVITPAVPEEPGAKPNLEITYENNSHALGHWSDYILTLPETLPKPSQSLAYEPQIKVRQKTTLKSIRKDLFTQEYGLTKRLENRCEITTHNPCGFFEPNGHSGGGAAAAEDFRLFTAMREAVGEYRIAQPQLAEFLPYLADEGLLEYHRVSLEAVRKLEDMRQRRIKMGVIQEYDRNVGPALPR